MELENDKTVSIEYGTKIVWLVEWKKWNEMDIYIYIYLHLKFINENKTKNQKILLHNTNLTH